MMAVPLVSMCPLKCVATGRSPQHGMGTSGWSVGRTTDEAAREGLAMWERAAELGHTKAASQLREMQRKGDSE